MNRFDKQYGNGTRWYLNLENYSGMVRKLGNNARPRAAEVLVDGDKFSLIRKRETYEDLITMEK